MEQRALLLRECVCIYVCAAAALPLRPMLLLPTLIVAAAAAPPPCDPASSRASTPPPPNPPSARGSTSVASATYNVADVPRAAAAAAAVAVAAAADHIRTHRVLTSGPGDSR